MACFSMFHNVWGLSWWLKYLATVTTGPSPHDLLVSLGSFIAWWPQAGWISHMAARESGSIPSGLRRSCRTSHNLALEGHIYWSSKSLRQPRFKRRELDSTSQWESSQEFAPIFNTLWCQNLTKTFIREENYSLMSLMNKDAKTLNKILSSQVLEIYK